MGLCGATLCNLGLDRHRAKERACGWGSRIHLSVFSHKRNRAEVRTFPLALSW